MEFGISLFEAVYGSLSDLSMLIPFGTHVSVKGVKAGKRDHRSKHGRFVAYDLESQGCWSSGRNLDQDYHICTAWIECG